MARSLDSFGSAGRLDAAGGALGLHRLDRVPGFEVLPFSHKVVLENLLRHEDGVDVTAGDVESLVDGAGGGRAIDFFPSRVFLHDTNGVPVLTDLAALRDAVADRGLDPLVVDTAIPAELTVDHSVATDFYGRPDAPRLNVAREYERNGERYRFLKWGQQTFDGLKVVPPGAGIMHQINVEHLAQVVTARDGWAFPDTVAGTDSHTTMVNGLSVLAWGVGGIEASAAMLGQPISMLVPPVLGVELVGELRPGVTATDLVLTITERMRAEGVVGSFVEFHGAGVAATSIATRCTIANMSPEFGSTAAMFPVDDLTLDFLRLTGRSADHVDLVERYAKTQGLWHDPSTVLRFDREVRIDLDSITPSLAGPRRPQDRVDLADARRAFHGALDELRAQQGAPASTAAAPATSDGPTPPVTGVPADGAVAIASITSCTNTSNPSVMVGAGLLARNAVRRGLRTKPWVKTSLAPGSRAVTDYLARAGLTPFLDQLGFDLVGYGCMTCIGNSGGLAPGVAELVHDEGLVVASVLSGNRNFDGRINNDVSMNYLASPPLVVAYALAGTLDHDLTRDPLGHDGAGEPVYLDDVWPSDAEIASVIEGSVDAAMYTDAYAHVFDGDDNWKALTQPTTATYDWDDASTYLRRPPWLESTQARAVGFGGARALLVVGDSVTTDHICPAGRIPSTSEAGRLLTGQGVAVPELNTYASRRGNWQVMERGGFANPRLENKLAPRSGGGVTPDFLDGGRLQPIHVAAAHYRQADVPLVVLAGREYGTGSSRDWAAKVTALLGVRAVVAESFERIHRSNLVNVGVLPLELTGGRSCAELGLDGTETFDLADSGGDLALVRATHPVSGVRTEVEVRVRLDTARERAYFAAGGILPHVLADLLAASRPVHA